MTTNFNKLLITVIFIAPIVQLKAQDLDNSSLPSFIGKDVVWLPQHEVPFLQSFTVVNYGAKNFNGECEFPLNSASSDMQLSENQRYITVQRAIDFGSCNELLEKGIVDINAHPNFGKFLDYLSENTLSETKQINSNVLPDTIKGSLIKSQKKSGNVKIWYTDKNNPTWQNFNKLPFANYNGITISGVKLNVEFTSNTYSDGCSLDGSAGYNIESGPIGWNIEPGGTFSAYPTSCYSAYANMLMTHYNKDSNIFFDCSQKLYVYYRNFRLTVNANSANKMTGFVVISGDMKNCGEYSVRYQDGPY